jgi:membrane-bound serine protease (ClpP class)
LSWSRRRRSVSGVEALVGKTAVVSTPTQVRVAGELWEATSEEPLVAGEEVEVTGVDGLTLRVSPRSRALR